MRAFGGGLAAVVLVLAVLVPGAACADGNPEDGLTQRAFREVTETAESTPGQGTAIAPAYAHNFTDAERAELDRMHAVRILKGKEWKRLSPEERNARIQALRDQMPGVSLTLTVPGGELWAIPPGEGNVNFTEILEKHLIRIWSAAEIEALAVAVGQGPARRDGANDPGNLARAPVQQSEP
jgi:sugar phosphate isomerase/epimerase